VPPGRGGRRGEGASRRDGEGQGRAADRQAAAERTARERADERSRRRYASPSRSLACATSPPSVQRVRTGAAHERASMSGNEHGLALREGRDERIHSHERQGVHARRQAQVRFRPPGDRASRSARDDNRETIKRLSSRCTRFSNTRRPTPRLLPEALQARGDNDTASIKHDETRTGTP
jgi:hypothetical protein